jgi:hypothetical protein
MIEISVNRKRVQRETVSETLDLVARHFGCKKSELTCEAAEPVRGGRMIWVWHGEFDADTAASLFVPTKTYIVWARWRGACRLA